MADWDDPFVEKFLARSQPVLLEIHIDGDEGDRTREHLSYRITIKTTEGDIVIRGNHDDGPSVERTDLLEETA